MDRGLPIQQYVDRPGILDLSWGHPNPSMLPTQAWATAAATMLTTYGSQALAYGYEAGPGPLRQWIAEHLAETDQCTGVPEEIFVTAGASHALTLVCATITRPGDIVLVDSPTYHLAFQIFLDQGVEVVGVPVDGDGVDPSALADLIAAARARGRRVPMLYIVPTFGNPTGRSLPDGRRREVVELARRTGVTIVEDDTYRELVYDGTAPASLWSQSDGTSVIRVGSFAKTVAPGLRLGWIQAARELVERLSGLGYVYSGGGVNHTAALAMATFGASGAYAKHVAEVRRQYASQRDTLVSALSRRGLDVATPAGGWFLWLDLPGETPAASLLPAAEQRGVSFAAGSTFYPHSDGGESNIRLSFSMLEPPELEEAARRLAAAIQHE